MTSESMKKHKESSPLKVKVGIITLSDSKYKNPADKDISGDIITKLIQKNHQLQGYKLIPDESDELLSAVKELQQEGAEIIITTGGTGIGPRDITIETLQPLFRKELNGFGEIFRYKSYKELGSGAILSRATAGVYEDVLIFSMPGSPNAVKTAMSIIIGELGHLAKHLKE